MLEIWLEAHLGKDWKSTVNGVLSAIMTLFGGVTTFLGTLAAIYPDRPKVWLVLAALVTLVTSSLRILIGAIQNYVPAEIPARTPPSGKVEMVATKVEPEDPNAIPVEPSK